MSFTFVMFFYHHNRFLCVLKYWLLRLCRIHETIKNVLKFQNADEFSINKLMSKIRFINRWLYLMYMVISTYFKNIAKIKYFRKRSIYNFNLTELSIIFLTFIRSQRTFSLMKGKSIYEMF